MKPLPQFERYFTAPPLSLAYGTYQPANDAEYFALPAINNGVLKEATPAEMLHHLREDDQDHYSTDAKAKDFTIGTIVHALFLELWKLQGDEWKNHFVDCPTKGLDTVKAQQLRAENPGKLVVNAEMFDIAMEIRQFAWKQNPQVRKFLGCPGITEVIGKVWDDRNLVWRKWKPDFVPFVDGKYGNYIADLKTTRAELTEGAWVRECWKFGYFLQAAWYLDCHEMLTGHRPDAFVWIVVSKKEPFMSRVFSIVNRAPTDPLYGTCTLKKARQSLGLDDNGGVGRILQFCYSARQTAAAQADGESLSDDALRGIWPGYEEEEEPLELF